MKDPTHSLMVAIIGKLDSYLSYNGVDYPVKTHNRTGYDLVLLRDVLINDDGTDTWFGTECAATLDIVTKAMDWTPANSIGTQITERLINDPPTVDGYRLECLPVLESINHMDETTATESIKRKIIRIIFKLQENG
jgi:hypothetical protein